jgi:hypothetical protein
MPGREFLELARELLALGTLPRHWRAVIIHAYYGLLLECREAMSRWRLPSLTRHEVHTKVRHRLIFSTDGNLKQIGFALEQLGENRNKANYDLRALPIFATVAKAQTNFQMGIDALALVDAIDADPARRATAVAAIQP